jgi:hypothetical protein
LISIFAITGTDCTSQRFAIVIQSHHSIVPQS